jgi:tetratricopeptide (TPR) repeat protein
LVIVKKSKSSKKSPLKGEILLRQAIKKLREGQASSRYKETEDLLFAYLEEKPDDLLARKLAGFCQIQRGRFEDAKESFQRVNSINRNDSEVMNALAYIALEGSDVDQAINCLLDAIYTDQNNQKLKSNLEKLRNIKDPKVFFSLTKPSDFVFVNIPKESLWDKLRHFPSELVTLPQMRFFFVLFILAAIGFAAYLSYPTLVNWWQDHSFKRGLGRGRVKHVAIQDIEKLVSERAHYNIRLSEEEVKRKFDMAKSFLEEKKRNRALILINELLNSNASDYIKERILILQGFVPEANSENLDFVPPVQDVIKIPFLYKGVAVYWSGTAVNLEHKERKETVFDLLINFVDQALVEGIAETHYTGFQNVFNGDKVVVFGEIIGITEDNKIIVKGKAVQKIYK